MTGMSVVHSEKTAVIDNHEHSPTESHLKLVLIVSHTIRIAALKQRNRLYSSKRGSASASTCIHGIKSLQMTDDQGLCKVFSANEDQEVRSQGSIRDEM